MDAIERGIVAFAELVWGWPLLGLLLGGGAYFVVASRLRPYRHFPHALGILTGRYDDADADGDIPHFQALSSALSGTLGLGNIAGVAVAITAGGPGAIFWMWATALVGIATKFFTCTLAVMYRGRDDQGLVQGGPMYVVVHGLGPRWRPLAVFFCVAAIFGTLPVFQSNQLTQVVRDVVMVPQGWVDPDDHLAFDLGFGLLLAAGVAAVIFGGIRRIGAVAGRLVPGMVSLYLLAVLVVLARHAGELPATFALIVSDAFTGQAAAGGAVGSVIVTGVRRGAFSNEAGVGTESLAHGAAKTREPVREGLVAMLGPVVDTLLVCSCTAFAILATGVWRRSDADGVTLTAEALEAGLPGLGAPFLAVLVVMLSVSTMFTFWYYGAKCLSFLVGTQRGLTYRWLYVALIVGGAVGSLDAVIALIDGMYALMAIPTMTSALLLSPRVLAASRSYFQRHGWERAA